MCEIVMLKQTNKRLERERSRGEACLLVRCLSGGIHPPVADLLLVSRAHSKRRRHLAGEQRVAKRLQGERMEKEVKIMCPVAGLHHKCAF